MASARVYFYGERILTEEEFVNTLDRISDGGEISDNDDEIEDFKQCTDENNNHEQERDSADENEDCDDYYRQIFAENERNVVHGNAVPNINRRVTRSETRPTAKEPTPEPVEEVIRPTYSFTPKDNIQWRQMRAFEPRDTTFVRPAGVKPSVKTPYEYFSGYLPSEFFENAATCTNTYAFQSESNGFPAKTF